MSVLALQFRFSRLLPQLLTKAHELGYEVTMGEAWRSTATARVNAERGTGVANSLHCERLAVDLNLFKDGEYCTEASAHAALGAWWLAQDAAARWGGRFASGDANHYSLSPDGVRG